MAAEEADQLEREEAIREEEEAAEDTSEGEEGASTESESSLGSDNDSSGDDSDLLPHELKARRIRRAQRRARRRAVACHLREARPVCEVARGRCSRRCRRRAPHGDGVELHALGAAG